jgi:phosphonate transport system ATP-binding protein
MHLQNQTLAYEDKPVLEDITLSIKKGEKVALLGKSGSGKSTLLRHFLSINPDASYIPQELGLVQSLSVFHNVYIANLEKHPFFYNFFNLFFPFESEIKLIVPILEKLEMQEYIFKPCGELSGGQMQRTAIARALLSNKETLLADEPISALDAYLAHEVMKLLTEDFQTIVCAIHNVDIALQFFERIIGIKDGKIYLDKPSAQLSQNEIEQLYNACSI